MKPPLRTARLYSIRARQQNPEAVQRWREVEFWVIQKVARQEGAKTFFSDESGIRSDYHSGTTWAAVGQTPVVQSSGSRFSLNMVSAISAKGSPRFMVVEGRMNGERFGRTPLPSGQDRDPVRGVAPGGARNFDVPTFDCLTSDCRRLGTSSPAAFDNPGDFGAFGVGCTSCYAFIQGTSMATPQVAGVAALALAAHPGMTPDALVRLLRRSVTSFADPNATPPISNDPGSPQFNYDVAYGTDGVTNHLMGTGVIDAARTRAKPSVSQVELHRRRLVAVTMQQPRNGAVPPAGCCA